MLVDVRGTGASFGTSRYGATEIGDHAAVMDWIVAQPWSNGRIGSYGISFEGTSAELTAATDRPAVRAVAPLYSDYDYYRDLVRPGGVLLGPLLRNLEAFTREQDYGSSAKAVAGAPSATLASAIAEHRNNIAIYEATRRAEFSDDPIGSLGSLDSFSPSAVTRQLGASNAPMLVLAGWLDAGTAQGALRRFNELTNPQTIFIGPWSHGGGYTVNLFSDSSSPAEPSEIQRRNLLFDFFEKRLTGRAAPAEPRKIHYFTTGENRWHATSVWPPKGLARRSLYFARSRLVPRSSSTSFGIELHTADSGKDNRWNTQLGGGKVDYSGALEARGLAAFTTGPLDQALEITGQPLVSLQMQVRGSSDPSLFVYLLAIAPNGRQFYLSEGQLRLIHRRLDRRQPTLHSYRRADALGVDEGKKMDVTLTLLPLSAVIPKGSKLRVILASGDKASFEATPEYRATILPASRLDLPSRTRLAGR